MPQTARRCPVSLHCGRACGPGHDDDGDDDNDNDDSDNGDDGDDGDDGDGEVDHVG